MEYYTTVKKKGVPRHTAGWTTHRCYTGRQQPGTKESLLYVKFKNR